ncbi:MAG: hypothetical protein NTW23_04525 [Rhodoluna sp.]|nr:hypothetical protein [Rhodoluna sp.]
MDLSVAVFLLVIVGLLLWLPLIGKKWSAIISYILFGSWFGLGAFAGFDSLSKPPAGASHQFAVAFLLVAAFGAAMVLLTYLVYRHRQRKSVGPSRDL